MNKTIDNIINWGISDPHLSKQQREEIHNFDTRRRALFLRAIEKLTELHITSQRKMDKLTQEQQLEVNTMSRADRMVLDNLILSAKQIKITAPSHLSLQKEAEKEANDLITQLLDLQISSLFEVVQKSEKIRNLMIK